MNNNTLLQALPAFRHQTLKAARSWYDKFINVFPKNNNFIFLEYDVEEYKKLTVDYTKDRPQGVPEYNLPNLPGFSGTVEGFLTTDGEFLAVSLYGFGGRYYLDTFSAQLKFLKKHKFNTPKYSLIILASGWKIFRKAVMAFELSSVAKSYLVLPDSVRVFSSACSQLDTGGVTIKRTVILPDKSEAVGAYTEKVCYIAGRVLDKKNLVAKLKDLGADVHEDYSDIVDIVIIPSDTYTNKTVDVARKNGIKVITTSQI